MMIRTGRARQLIDMVVVDASGDWVGTVSEVYLDEQTGDPLWVTVRVGWFGHGSFVPLLGVDISGIRIRAPYDKATIRASPRHDSCTPLTPGEERALYAYYGLSTTTDAPGAPTGEDAARATPPRLRRYVGLDADTPSSPQDRPRIERDPIGGDFDDGDTFVRSVN